jgi:hypothetical protein
MKYGMEECNFIPIEINHPDLEKHLEEQVIRFIPSLKSNHQTNRKPEKL